jgi:hypothetical protein
MTRQNLSDLEGAGALLRRSYREAIPEAVRAYRERLGMADSERVKVIGPANLTRHLTDLDGMGNVEVEGHDSGVGVYLTDPRSYLRMEGGTLDLGPILGWRWRLRRVLRRRWVR